MCDFNAGSDNDDDEDDKAGEAKIAELQMVDDSLDDLTLPKLYRLASQTEILAVIERVNAAYAQFSFSIPVVILRHPLCDQKAQQYAR